MLINHQNPNSSENFERSLEQIRVLVLGVIWSLCKPIPWSIIFSSSYVSSLFKRSLKILRGIRVLMIDQHSPTQLSKTRVFNLIRSSSTFWFKFDSMGFYMLLIIYEQKIEVQFWLEEFQLIRRGKMVSLVKISQSQSWPRGLLVNHQFKYPLFIFHDQIHN